MLPESQAKLEKFTHIQTLKFITLFNNHNQIGFRKIYDKRDDERDRE